MNLPPDNDMMCMRILQEEARQTEGISIRYILYEMRTVHDTYYAIEICTGDETALAILGKKYTRAQRLLEIMINETVTPCVLSEILRDVEACEEERRHCQNLCKI